MTKAQELQQAPSSAIATTPAQLLQIAVDKGADIERLEKLMDLQLRWEASEARKSFVEAMTEFRAECPVITKNRDAHNSRYATLAHTLSLVQGLLSKYGLSHTWKTEQGESGLIAVTCCVTHRQGHQECTSMSAQADTSGSKNSIQAIGSTVSYLERYTLFAILGLASTDQDDDGAAGDQGAITDEQAANLQALFDEVGGDLPKFLQPYNCDSIETMPAKFFKRAVKRLEDKRSAS